MSMIDSIRRQMTPVHPAGYPFIAAFAVATLILYYFLGPLSWIGAILTAWCIYFFRDPERVTPVDDRLVVSPADGIVSSIGFSSRRRNSASAPSRCSASRSSCRCSTAT